MGAEALMENAVTRRDPGLDGDAAATAAAIADADRCAELEADVDSFADWLAAECAGHQDERCGYVSTKVFAHDFSAMSTARVVAHLLYPSTHVAGQAAWELRTRYLTANGVQA